MLVIPAIDLQGGEAVRLYKGDYKQKTVYSSHPEELAKTLERGGQQAPTGPADEGMVFEMTEEELKKFVSESAIAAYNKLKEGKSGIHIDPENKGKFTATKERTGKSTEELTHSKNPLTRKRANFARMAKRGWKPLKNKD